MPKSELSLAALASELLITDLRTVLETPSEVLSRIAQELDSDHGFRLADVEHAMKIWTGSGVAAQHFVTTIRVLQTCFGFAVDNEKTVDDLLVEIEEICDQHTIPGFDETRDALKELLTPSERYLLRRKVYPWAIRGFENLEAIEHTVGLRAAYESEGAITPLGLVPLATLRLSIKHDDDKDSQMRRIALQLPEEDIDRLIGELNTAKKRLAELRNQIADKVTIFDDIIGGAWSKQDGN